MGIWGLAYLLPAERMAELVSEGFVTLFRENESKWYNVGVKLCLADFSYL